MPDEIRRPTRDSDPYAWALAQSQLIAKGGADLKSLDLKELQHFLEEWADAMLGAAKSQLVNLMAHLAKAAFSANPAITGHWRSECEAFHVQLVEDYRPSMRRRIDMERLWRRAQRVVFASFADHGERKPELPDPCPFTLPELVDEDLDIERACERLRQQRSESRAG